MDKPSILDILVGYCAGKGGFDRIERRRLQRHLRTLPDPSESHGSIESNERAKPSNFLTPWKESNFGITFRCRRSPSAGTQYRYRGRFSSFNCSDRAVVLEIGSTSPEGKARSPTPPKQLSFTIPPVWSTEHITSFPTMALPELVVSRLQETQLNATLRGAQQHGVGRQSSSGQQSPNSKYRGDDNRSERGTRTITGSTNHLRRMDSRSDEPNTRVGRGSEAATRVFPPTSQQTTIERVLHHEYLVRGLLRDEGPTTEGRRHGVQQDDAVITRAPISDKVEMRTNGFISGTSIEESSSPCASAKRGRTKRHVARMRYRASKAGTRATSRRPSTDSTRDCSAVSYLSGYC